MHIPVVYYILAVLIALVIGSRRSKWEGVLIGYCYLVLASTVLNRTTRNVTEYDFRLLKFVFVNCNLLQQATSNMMMFIPIGIITAKLRHSPVLTGTVFSVIIETLQLIFHKGVFEVDDLISNTFGALVGGLLYGSIEYLIRMKKNKY